MFLLRFRSGANPEELLWKSRGESSKKRRGLSLLGHKGSSRGKQTRVCEHTLGRERIVEGGHRGRIGSTENIRRNIADFLRDRKSPSRRRNPNLRV